MRKQQKITAVRLRKNLHVQEAHAPADYTIDLRTSPHVQTAAIAYLASRIELDPSDNRDESLNKESQPLGDCCSVMGIAEDSPLAEDVHHVVMELSDKMRDALVKAGLLRPDCAKAWQEEKVAQREESSAKVAKIA